ncbi:hypothetical protein [Psychrobacter phenylpyruvicus]|uniref:Uncharacterized protein n=1 Tax=Psychrobacter phenylpyruvicus TaxID=29432 RepID=A0A379LLV6_9GAMM|nr:hypothetical protein [Psychrobacter phenylpyruvicus]SUD90764.1 Uncharacterised protein [Psychrobacter phenylpyruvicus]
MGSELMNYLQNSEVLPKFKEIMGEIVEDRQIVNRPGIVGDSIF